MSSVVYKSLDFMDYPLYRVGDDGSLWVLRFDRNKKQRWRQIKGGDLNGYRRASLHNKHGRYFTKEPPLLVMIHVLVLTAFVGPCPEGMECRHFPDRNRSNNRLTNLSWGTRTENMQDKFAHDTHQRGSKSGMAKLIELQVLEIRKDRIQHVGSQREYARIKASKFGVSVSTVRTILRSKLHWPHVVV